MTGVVSFVGDESDRASTTFTYIHVDPFGTRSGVDGDVLDKRQRRICVIEINSIDS